MDLKVILIIFTLLAFNYAQDIFESSWPSCSSDMVGGTNCTISVYNVLSTQFSLGFSEVNCRIGYLETLSKDEIIKYLQKSDLIVPLVIGPGGFYMTNGHHLARAVMDANIDNSVRYLFATITDNWGDYSIEQFWQRMIEADYAWLYDGKGLQPIPPEFIPPLEQLLDDPYRSLAWLSRNEGAYAKTPVPFSDFMWGNFYREHINLLNITSNSIQHERKDTSPVSWEWCQVRPYSPECFPDQEEALDAGTFLNIYSKKALPVALQLAKSPLASSLPGYNQGTVSPPKCGNTKRRYSHKL